jgi:hypothetical protein
LKMHEELSQGSNQMSDFRSLIKKWQMLYRRASRSDSKI